MTKFLQAILLVGVFALFVFVILYLYKKFIVNTNKPVEKPSLENSLESPANMDDALRMFLDKTKPNQ
jgi:heme/copper-type cytochrome/quinol oxidase subunit 1